MLYFWADVFGVVLLCFSWFVFLQAGLRELRLMPWVTLCSVSPDCTEPIMLIFGALSVRHAPIYVK